MPLIHVNTFTHNIYNRHRCTFMCAHTHAHTYVHPHVHRDACTHMCIYTYLYLSLLNHCTSSLILKPWLLGRICSHLGPSFQPSDFYCFFNLYKKCPQRHAEVNWEQKTLPGSMDGILAPTKLLRYLGGIFKTSFSSTNPELIKICLLSRDQKEGGSKPQPRSIC